MKVLIVCSFNSGSVSPFVKDQVDSLSEKDIDFEYYKIVGSGIYGYLKNVIPLRRKIENGKYDLIHAHYGLSGLLANFQKKLPVVTTYHGSDVHFRKNRFFSKISSTLSRFNILTNSKQIEKLGLKKKFEVIPCGIDTSLFKPMDKEQCRKKMGINTDTKIVLFSSAFDREVKNSRLAKKSIQKLHDQVKLIELKGYNRQEVACLINASDAVLVTSFYETGPLIVKEALACNVPVVSTDVGDIAEIFGEELSHLIVDYDADFIAEKLKYVFNLNYNVNCRERVLQYDLANIAARIASTYNKVLDL